MLTKVLTHDQVRPTTPKEGDLYKDVNISGKTFRLLYGYYESFERESPFNDPMPIYPDFTKDPHYTSEGIPIVTAMQNPCGYYKGKHHEDRSCVDCHFFLKSEELFGLCGCPHRKQCQEERADVKDA